MWILRLVEKTQYNMDLENTTQQQQKTKFIIDTLFVICDVEMRPKMVNAKQILSF